MALDFIGGGWLAVQEGLAGETPALSIGAIVRAMVARPPGALAGDALPLW